MRSSISLFYTPARPSRPRCRRAQGAAGRAGQARQRGQASDGRVEFVIADQRATSLVRFNGDLPDLFREGQGVVAAGAFDATGPSPPPRFWPSTTSATCAAKWRRP
ncbi:cytochrome c maturation protein CcmE [Caulobacter sp. B11]|uniref:cytochrome c maturation protein CcmE domain-containing protein n=1 Tax=Caulobacter sp. B11 TaxID=2048899 RepID=UPI0035134248